MEFSEFCNICWKQEDVIKMSTEENTTLLDTLITLIGHLETVNENIVYLCSYCCNKLDDINKFRDMCITNFIQFRKSCDDFKRQLEISKDPDINSKLKLFIDRKMGRQNSDEENEELGVDDNTKIDDREVELEQVFIKEEPEDMISEDEPVDLISETEPALDYNMQNQMTFEITDIKRESVGNEYKLESEIDLGITNSVEGEPNSIITPSKSKRYTPIPLKSFSSSDIITEHITETNSNGDKKKSGSTRRYICNVCRKPFQKLYNLMRHRLVHTGEKPYRCNLCNKTFNDSSYLKIHLRLHTGEKPYECQVCKKSFTDLSNLNRHRLVHSAEKPYECDICQKSFNALSCLNRHRLIHTDDKPYRCNFCDRTFGNIRDMKIHQLIHTGEKPHQCEICKKSFTLVGNLNRHRLIHTGEKPHRCNFCKKTFTQSRYLNIHRLIHTGEKLHQCNICKKSFAASSGLSRHRKVHTENLG